uniref:hypothetical protein n=1 Tax=Streptomyces caniscabiei TaxID=2746961 RepID=UPI0029CA42D1|nr:hypothetical protein [Streptomyces caniscabiei]
MFQLPTYAPDLNPQDGIWSLVKRESATLPQPTWARSPGPRRAGSSRSNTARTSSTAALRAPASSRTTERRCAADRQSP